MEVEDEREVDKEKLDKIAEIYSDPSLAQFIRPRFAVVTRWCSVCGLKIYHIHYYAYEDITGIIVWCKDCNMSAKATTYRIDSFRRALDEFIERVKQIKGD